MKCVRTVYCLILTALLPLAVCAKQKKENNDAPKASDTARARLNYSLQAITNRLDNMHLTLNRISDFSGLSFNTARVEQQLPAIRDNLNTIAENLSHSRSVQEIKNLQLFGVLLKDMQERLQGWRSALFKYNSDLINMNVDMDAFTHDSIIRQLIKDPRYRRMYVDELTVLQNKWQQADTFMRAHLDTVNNLQYSISQLYFQTIDLESQVSILNKDLGSRLFGKEYNYLWQSPDSGTTRYTNAHMARQSYEGQQKIMGYFIRSNWNNYFYVLALGGLFFFWTWNNFRRIKKSPEPGKILKDVPLNYLRRYPLLPTLVFMLCIIPFFNIDAPAAYNHILQLPLLLVLCILFGDRWPRDCFYYWLFITLLYVLFSVTDVVLIPSMGSRLWLLLLNALCASLGYMTVSRIIRKLSLPLLLRVAAIIFLACHIIAIGCNLMGRLSLAKIVSTAGIAGLVQVFGLMVFVNSFLEALSLQAAMSRLSKAGTGSPEFYDRVSSRLFRLLVLLSLFTWLIVFIVNLDLYNAVFNLLKKWLGAPRSLGSISFRLGNILIFVVIIYISNTLQKYIGYLFDPKQGQALPAGGKKSSRLVMLRLVLIILGFMLAIAASGLPVDKITIVLGALGVGIGLGLQTIVNNLVSGIILIFEQPFEIGDYIELNGKKGIVRDIGIRSSRLVTAEGTEIIMPNGDLLAGEVINWTVQNNKVRIEVPMTVEAGPGLDQINAIVQEALAGYSDLSNEDKPAVLLSTATDKTLSFTIIAWVGNISQIQNLKSEILRLMYAKLKEKGIKTI